MTYKVNDFFCGAGGMGLGFDQAGFSVAGAWDYDKFAVQSYKHNLSDVVLQADIAEMDYLDIPKADVWTFGFPCFIAGTLVLTDKGYKPIEEIQKGDKVLTHQNRYKEVVTPMVNHADHLYRIKTMPSEDLLVTEEHPFYVRKKTQTLNDDSKTMNTSFSSPEWVKAKELNASYYVGTPINQNALIPKWEGTDNNENDLKESQTKNTLSMLFEKEAFWWFVGRYVAESKTATDGSATLVTCAKEEFKEVSEILNQLPIPYTLIEERYDYIFYFVDETLTEYLSQFGNAIKEKHLTSDILDLPRPLLQSFIKGYMSPEFVDIAQTQKIKSDNRTVLYGMGQSIAKAYHRPVLIRSIGENKFYELVFYLTNDAQDQAFYADGYIWSPIHSVTKEAYDGLVYNMEVEEDNSYTVQNVIVHNCQDISIAGKQKGMIKGETRSGLFYEIMRMLDETQEYEPEAMPSLILAENVKAVRNLLPEIEKEYAERGYKMVYVMYNSKQFGVPQNRERYFILGVHNSIEADYAFPVEPYVDIPKLHSILENDVPEKFYIPKENAETVINQAKERVTLTGVHACLTPGRTEKRQAGRRAKGEDELMYTLTAQDHHGVIDVIGRLDIKGQDNVRRVYNADGVSPTLTTSEGGNRQPKVLELLPPKVAEDAFVVVTDDGVGIRVRKLTPREYARLQGFPDAYEQIVSNSQFYKQMGNAVTVNVAQVIATSLVSFLNTHKK